MSNELHFAHECEYRKTYALAQKGVAIFGALVLMTIFLRYMFLVFSGWFLAGSILFGVVLIGYLVVILVYGAKLKMVGEFEKIDISDNKIIYVNQMQGQAIFSPQNILKVAFERKPYGGVVDPVIYFKNSNDIFLIPKTVSGYSELVKKIEKFVEDNSLPREDCDKA